jgi:hypothetical protein
MVLIAVAVDIVFAALAIVGARRAMRKMLRPPAFKITTQATTSSGGAPPIEPVYGKGSPNVS